MGLCASDRSDIYVVDSPRSRRFRKQLFMHHWGLADERSPQRVHFQNTYGPYDLRLLTIYSLEGVDIGGELAGELRHNAGASTRPRPRHEWATQCSTSISREHIPADAIFVRLAQRTPADHMSIVSAFASRCCTGYENQTYKKPVRCRITYRAQSRLTSCINTFGCSSHDVKMPEAGFSQV